MWFTSTCFVLWEVLCEHQGVWCWRPVRRQLDPPGNYLLPLLPSHPPTCWRTARGRRGGGGGAHNFQVGKSAREMVASTIQGRVRVNVMRVVYESIFCEPSGQNKPKQTDGRLTRRDPMSTASQHVRRNPPPRVEEHVRGVIRFRCRRAKREKPSTSVAYTNSLGDCSVPCVRPPAVLSLLGLPGPMWRVVDRHQLDELRLSSWDDVPEPTSRTHSVLVKVTFLGARSICVSLSMLRLRVQLDLDPST